MTSIKLAHARSTSPERRRTHQLRPLFVVHRRVRLWPAALRELDAAATAALDQLARAELHIAEHERDARDRRRAAREPAVLDVWQTTLRELIARCRDLEDASNYALTISVPQALIRRHQRPVLAARERLDRARAYDALDGPHADRAVLDRRRARRAAQQPARRCDPAGE